MIERKGILRKVSIMKTIVQLATEAYELRDVDVARLVGMVVCHGANRREFDMVKGQRSIQSSSTNMGNAGNVSTMVSQ